MHIGRALGNPVITHGCPIRSDTPTIRTQSVSVARRHTYLIAKRGFRIPPWRDSFFLSPFPPLFPPTILPFPRLPSLEFYVTKGKKKIPNLDQFLPSRLENTDEAYFQRGGAYFREAPRVYLVATNFYALWLESLVRIWAGEISRRRRLVGNSFNRSVVDDDDDDDTGFRSFWLQRMKYIRRNWYGRFNKRVGVNILVANIWRCLIP